jgi:hypothetical protein
MDLEDAKKILFENQLRINLQTKEERWRMAYKLVGWCISEHLNIPSCPLGGAFIRLTRNEVDTCVRFIDPNACIEEVNHQGTRLVVYRGTIPQYGDYTFAIDAESMIREELRMRSAIKN